MDGQNTRVEVQENEIRHIHESLDRIERRQETMEKTLNLILPNCAVHAIRLAAAEQDIAGHERAIAQKTWEARAIGVVASLLAAVGIGKP